MMALAALGMAHKKGGTNADALDHYQNVIPELKSRVRGSQDSCSDGAFFTHFLLMLYEVRHILFSSNSPCSCAYAAAKKETNHSDHEKIAAAGQRESNMWQPHIQQLLRIITLRR
jgi:hypothetical protein